VSLEFKTFNMLSVSSDVIKTHLTFIFYCVYFRNFIKSGGKITLVKYVVDIIHLYVKLFMLRDIYDTYENIN
jgi:hypothetical protein